MRLKVLLSAYACEPGKGSEPGIGWHTAKAIAKDHDVWVMTRANNRELIEAELAKNPMPAMTFIYYDLPTWLAWWKKGGRGVRLYYYLWQVAIYFLARRLHRDVKFDLSHHVTFGMYWAPSFISRLNIPFVWGPVGGGESAPKSFWPDFSKGGQRYERLREINQWFASKDPFIRATAAKSAVTLTTTQETLDKIKTLPLNETLVQGNCALSEAELSMLAEFATQAELTQELTFISIGRLLHWKGYHLALKAFAKANLDAHYWIIGSGPEREALEQLSRDLGVAERVSFLGKLPREKTLKKLAQSSVFLHPSLHDSGGWATLEAMACAKPVICLDLGGPATQITQETGAKVKALNPEQAVVDLATAMQDLKDPAVRERMSQAAQARVQSVYSWTEKGKTLNSVYTQVMTQRQAQSLEKGQA